MTSKRFSGVPDEFSSSPLLALLPAIGDVTKLPTFAAALYARSEKVSNALTQEDEIDEQLRRRLGIERAMLTQVLDWVSSVEKESGGGGVS